MCRLMLFLAIAAGGVFLMQKGSQPFLKEWRARLGTRTLYRKRWFVIRFAVVAGIWLIGIIVQAVFLTSGDGWTVRTGGYVGAVLLVLGLAGTTTMLLGSRGRPSLWIDPEGSIYDQLPPE